MALVLLAISILLPYVLALLGYVAIGAIALVLIARKLHLGWGRGGLGRRRDRREEPRTLVTNLRIGVPKQTDPRAIAQEFSCRLLSPQRDGAIEVSGGDDVQISGRLDASKLIHVRTMTVTATGYRASAAAGASAAPVATATLLILGLCGGALWINRAWLSPEVFRQALYAVEASAVQLVGTIVTILIAWFVIKKVIFRR